MAAAQANLIDYLDNVTFVHSNYENLENILTDYSPEGIDGILLIWGILIQLDEGNGLSCMRDAPLDMRMDRRTLLAKNCQLLRYRRFRTNNQRLWGRTMAKRIVQLL